MSETFDHLGRARLERARAHPTEDALLADLANTGGPALPYIVARNRAGGWTAILCRPEAHYIDRRATDRVQAAGYLVLG